MNRTLRNFLAVSMFLHLGAALLWQGYRPPAIGASAGELQVALLPHASRQPPAVPVSAHNPAPRAATPPRNEAAPELATSPARPTRPSANPRISRLSSTAVTTAAHTAAHKTRQQPAPPKQPVPQAAAGKPVPAGASASPNDEATRISAALRRRLAAYFEYPLLARRRGWQGEVMLELRLEPDGEMTNIEVVRSSGHGVLDRSAVQSARNAGHVPEAVAPLAGRHYVLVVPVQYRLVGS